MADGIIDWDRDIVYATECSKSLSLVDAIQTTKQY